MNKTRSIRVAVFSLLLVMSVVLNVRESRRQAFFSERRMLMDTVISIKAWPADSSEAVARAFDEFATVEKKASFHIAESELSQLNNTGTLDLHASSSELLQIGVDFYHRTEGYFDPSFALLQKAYGFYDEKGRLPSDEEISQILATGCGLERVLARDDERWLLAPGSLLDFGGLAGGYAIERAKMALRAASCSAFLIDDAGDIWFEGQKPDGKAWRIAVRDPRDNTA
ncbi:MAG TPA: FAD:protein FMN transferase, partial [Candidatus Rifleibacterium sp.]|nr:FAD:protein FMN transferase [Candidatus Rifleibacterium sp.]